MKRIFKLVIASLLSGIFVLSLCVVPVSADGMIVPPPGQWVYQSDQKAVVYYQDGTEVLVLSIKFQGDAKDFAWIIPAPTRPTVEKAREDLFENLEKLTRSVYKPMPGIMRSMGFEARDLEEKVIVWETKKIDIYEISVLSSTDSQALQEWLVNNGYQYPKTYEYLLRDYISDYWFFVAVKIDTTVEPSVARQKLKTGHAAPLKLTFKTSHPIYPMRISAVTYVPKPTPTPTVAPTVTPAYTPIPTQGPIQPLQEDSGTSRSGDVVSKRVSPIYPPQPYRAISVTLYVLADRKMQASGYSTRYAGWFLPKTIKELSVDRNGKAWVEPTQKMFLTKLYRYYQVSEISDDVVLLPAADNKVVGGGKRWVIEPWKAWLLVLSPLIIEFAVLGGIALIEVRKWPKKSGIDSAKEVVKPEAQEANSRKEVT